MSTRHHNDGLRKLCTCARRNWPKCSHPWHFNFKPRGGQAWRFSLDAGEDAATMAWAFTRAHRMPAPNSPHLAGFKHEYAKQGRYALRAGHLSPQGELQLAADLTIEKSDLVFRQAKDVGRRDIDRMVFGPESDERFH